MYNFTLKIFPIYNLQISHRKDKVRSKNNTFYVSIFKNQKMVNILRRKDSLQGQKQLSFFFLPSFYLFTSLLPKSKEKQNVKDKVNQLYQSGGQSLKLCPRQDKPTNSAILNNLCYVQLENALTAFSVNSSRDTG